MRIDLHLHSNASDGALPPADVVRAARDGGLDLIALTDHDTVAGVAAAQAAAGDGVRVIAGIELSAAYREGEVHILGYFIDPASPVMREYGTEAARGREDRMRQMVHRLQRLGIGISYDDVLAAAGPDAASIARPHLARAMVERGAVRNYAEAFDRYIGDDGPAYVPTEFLTPRGAIERIHEAGGVAVWAHPPVKLFQTELDRFVEWGLDGVECFRPRNTAAETALFRRGARRFDLLVTGGSDWHGDWHGPLGTFAIGRSDVEAFLARGGSGT